MSLPRGAWAASILGLYVARTAAAESTGIACYEYGVDYTGYDILTLSGVNSASLCMESCAQSSECMYWSWSSETNVCYLKSAAALLGRSDAENIVSGPRSCKVEEGCFKEGVDYVGYDVSRIEGRDVASAQACQDLCAIEPKCAFFSYKTSARDCYLKSSAAPNGRTADADVISGPRVCSRQGEEQQPESPPASPDLPEVGCAEGSVEYRGRDVAVTKNVRSPAYCQQLCESNQACFFWTWDKTRRTCHQKDESAGNNRVTGRQTLDKVSGAKDCLPTIPGCQLLNTTFLGETVRHLRNSATFEACQQNCQSDASCAYWSWDRRSKVCQLRGETPYGYMSDPSTNGVVAGPKFCPSNDVCVEQADYVGHDLEAIEDGSVASAVECRTICRRTEGCEFWTWVQGTGNCYLKTEDALLGKRNGLATLGRYSGPKECAMHYGCIDLNTAYMSSSATQVKNLATFKECEDRCKNATDCNRWTYLSGTRVCILLKATDAAEKISFDGALSGSDCDRANTQSQHKCLTLGVRYKNAEMAVVANITSVNDCQYECLNAAACKAFTFQEGVGCYLYDKEPSELTPYPATFATAMSGTPQCGDEIQGEPDTCYKNNIIEGATFYAFTDDECADACANVPTCKFWTYNPHSRVDSCTLHKAGATRQTCAGSRSSSKFVAAGTFEFSRYNAPSVSVAGVDSFEACRAKCAENDMHYWTYYPASHVCKLHDEGSYNRVPDLDSMCGTVRDPLE